MAEDTNKIVYEIEVKGAEEAAEALSDKSIHYSYKGKPGRRVVPGFFLAPGVCIRFRREV